MYNLLLVGNILTAFLNRNDVERWEYVGDARPILIASVSSTEVGNDPGRDNNCLGCFRRNLPFDLMGATGFYLCPSATREGETRLGGCWHVNTRRIDNRNNLTMNAKVR
jgi:hypothetical protein